MDHEACGHHPLCNVLDKAVQHSIQIGRLQSHSHDIVSEKPVPSFCREVALSVEIEIAESGHLRPLALLGAATCGHLRPPAGSGHLRPLAATCGHSLGAATCGHSRPLAATCGHLRPLAGSGHLRPLARNCRGRPLAATCGQLGAATCGHSLGAATCSHLRPLEWLPVAASGCVLVVIHGRVGILKKISFVGKTFFFKFGGWIGRILSCLAEPCG